MRNYEDRHRLVDEAREQFPQGLPMSHLLDELVMPGPDEDQAKPSISRLPELVKPMARYIKAYFGNSFEWDQHFHRLPAELFKNFTTDEKLRLLKRTVLMSDLGEEIEYNVRYSHFSKLRLALWHWGHTESYADFVRFYNGIRSFDFGIEGFETRFDHTAHCNERGYANYHRKIYLDAELAYMIYHKGKHVLTIGFTPTKRGVMLAQVQCAQKHGNRWLYKLPKNLLEHVVERFQKTFPQDDIYVINGKSLAARILANYSKDAPPETIPTEECLSRIARTYTPVITGHRRGKHYRRNGVLFKKITPWKRKKKSKGTLIPMTSPQQLKHCFPLRGQISIHGKSTTDDAQTLQRKSADSWALAA